MPDNSHVDDNSPKALFKKLDQEEKLFLQITALLDSDTPKDELFRIVQALFKAPASPFSWKRSRVDQIHRKLFKLELIDNHNRCHPELLEETARRPLDKRTLDLCRQLIRSSYIDSGPQAENDFNLPAKTLRDFRLALFSHDHESLQKALPIFYQAAYNPLFRHPYAALTIYPFDRKWFLKLPLPFQFTVIDDAITHSLEDLQETQVLDEFIKDQFPAEKASSRPFVLLYAHKLLLSGRLNELEELYQQHTQMFYGSGLKGAMLVLEGDLAAAAGEFADDLDFTYKLNPGKTAAFDAPIALFYTITAGHIQTATDWEKVADILKIGEQEFAYNPFTRDLFRLAEVLLHFFRGFSEAARESLEKVEKRPGRSIFTLLNNLVSYWLTGSIEDEERKKLKQLKLTAEKHNFPWIALESAVLLNPDTDNQGKDPVSPMEAQLKALAPAINFEPAWRRTLNAIRQATPDPHATSPATADRPANRLAWFVHINRDHSLQLTPKIQKRNLDNSWTTGRNLAFERITNGDELPFFSPQDRRICAAIRKTEKAAADIDATPEQKHILQELAGHPYIFRSDKPRIPVILNQAQVTVIISRDSDFEASFTIRLEPDLKGRDFMVTEESENRFNFYSSSREINNIARLLGEKGLTLPLEAEEEILATIRDLAATLPIFSDLDPDPNHDYVIDESAAEADSSRLYLQIFPTGDGLIFDLKVKPLEASGPALTPGRGPRHLLLKIADRSCSANRNLELESERTRRLLMACSAFTGDYPDFHWQIDNLEECLNTLAEIQDFQNELIENEGDNWLICEWPAGEKISLKRKVQGSAFKLRVESRQDWFKIEGELQVDENEVVTLQKLLQQSRSGPGRFLKLAEGEFISLTEQLRERLLELSLYLQEDEEESGLKLHRGAINGVSSIIENFSQVQYDRLWHKQMEHFKKAAEFTPILPDSLQIELRSYQIEGFNWLAKLAYLGFGACLADDMGLGKTVQTLALILTRAANGPTLVVAPTSVCANWFKECARFAPKLNPIQFGGTERQEIINGLQPFDLMICSYTMLQQERRLIAGREWEVIVLDEAQAIKNMNTKRSQAAMSLSGRFRLITTGTPMENHLGELWNLFNFINPGLLGSLKQFSKRFALPIEQNNDHEAREHLRKLIKPFILRRLKSQVLKELPERTEIMLEVKMSEAERNFYEAVRRQAIDRLEEASDRKTGAGPSIQVLAELTRLRLAACNPRLIEPESQIESAKLELFGRIIDDLAAGNHQALVFSQFVKHLNLIRAYLDNRDISYRYLDGSTPKAKREDEINAFQEGRSDLFLISLKAGGLGLNLTAADYVLHLDPWWNPAIEDQASDRAHRIGQTRPVTVYRLITKTSIEEKIVRLHQEKRNLADQILTASDQSARFSTKELLELIKMG